MLAITWVAIYKTRGEIKALGQSTSLADIMFRDGAYLSNARGLCPLIQSVSFLSGIRRDLLHVRVAAPKISRLALTMKQSLAPHERHPSQFLNGFGE